MTHLLHHSLAALVVTQAQAEGGPSSILNSPLPVLILMFAVIYFLLIRPANKQRSKHAKLVNELKKGDEIVTNGGVYGRIVELEEKVCTLEISDKVKIRILRERIAGLWEPKKPSASK